jgi:hypothetical protein
MDQKDIRLRGIHRHPSNHSLAGLRNNSCRGFQSVIHVDRLNEGKEIDVDSFVANRGQSGLDVGGDIDPILREDPSPKLQFL